MVTTTIRFPDGLYQQVSGYAEENDLSKNQVIKMAVRDFLKRNGTIAEKRAELSNEASKKK